MATQKQLQDVFAQNQYDLKTAAKRSTSWFQQQARMLQTKGVDPDSVLKGDPSKNVRRIEPGSLYMFLYDPKTKDDLPYYDVFPLVFPYKKTPGGFIGLNMHYLPYQPRIILLQRLMEYANNSKMDSTTKIKYSWGLINGVARFKWAEPCIHSYLTGHVQSSMRKIAPADWATAMLLPVEQFVGASRSRVWKDSLGK
jgi:hypothetical protein